MLYTRFVIGDETLSRTSALSFSIARSFPRQPIRSLKDFLMGIEQSLRQVERRLWCGHNERSFSCAPTSKTDAGGSPDSSLLAHHHPDLPACHRRVRSV